jgi:nucleotide-binding universal stress UspA family protein
MRPIQTILHPTDFAEHSRYALDLACALARDQGARLIVLHIVPSPMSVRGSGSLMAVRQSECSPRDLLGYLEDRKEMLERLALPGLAHPAARLLKEGDIPSVILQAARDTSCDLIVMGTHHWTGEFRRLLGSVAEQVAGKAPCPVIYVQVPRMERVAAEQPMPEEADVIL